MTAQTNGIVNSEKEKKKQDALAQQTTQPAQAQPTATATTTTTTFKVPDVVQSDYSDYLKDFYKQQEDAAIADIEHAYEKNIAEVDRAAASIPKQYETARNQAAGNAAIAQRNSDIRAAASGLGVGTGAQARIANQNTYQRNLNSVNTAEAEAKADLELKRTQLAADYNNAIAQAKANGNAALAEALYNEYIRAEQSLISQQQFNANLGFQQQQHADTMERQAWNDAFEAWKFGYTGDYKYDGNGYFPPNYDGYWPNQTGSTPSYGFDYDMYGGTLDDFQQQTTLTQQQITDTIHTAQSQISEILAKSEAEGFLSDEDKERLDSLSSLIKYLGGQVVGEDAPAATLGNDGGVYQVGPDGKAPKGLSVGDRVVTAGGTYEITAVNADGSYQSKLVDKSQTTEPTTPTSSFDYELWGSKDEYYENLGRTNLAENLVADLKNQTEQVRLDNLMYYANTGKLDTAEFGYVLSRLGYNPDEWIDW